MSGVSSIAMSAADGGAAAGTGAEWVPVMMAAATAGVVGAFLLRKARAAMRAGGDCDCDDDDYNGAI